MQKAKLRSQDTLKAYRTVLYDLYGGDIVRVKLQFNWPLANCIWQNNNRAALFTSPIIIIFLLLCERCIQDTTLVLLRKKFAY